ncbi:MAG: hypothetical protein AAF798_09010 [Bacteroidota bacterium]
MKRKLKNKLLNTLFFIDTNQPNFIEIQKAYYECYKNVAIIKILLGKNARKPAVNLAENTIKKAIRFEFVDITIALARVLRVHYGSIMGNKKKFNHYHKLTQEYAEIANAEIKVEGYYSALGVNIVNSRATKKELAEIATAFADDLEQIIKKYSSYRINLHAYLVLTLQYEIVNDFQNALGICQNALSFFNKKKHIASKTVLLIFNRKLLSCYLRPKKYEDASKSLKECLQYVNTGDLNWFRTLDIQMILCFHTSNFAKAFEVYLLARNHPKFDQLHADLKEHWLIHEAFVFYFISIGKLQPKNIEEAPKFRRQRFFNMVPVLSKDKQGTNTSILILQFLFLLQERKYGKIIELMEPLKTYNHRYLRKDETFRINCFIKMLLQIPAASFHKQAVVRKSKQYWDKLRSVPIEVANQSAEIEIVPYEMLWDFVLELLDDKFH